MPTDRRAARPQVTEAMVRDRLRLCIDPELNIDIISLGLVYRVTVHAESIDVQMTLTTPGCPLRPYFEQRVDELVTPLDPRREVKLEIVFDPPWSPAKMSVEVKSLFAQPN